MICSCLLFMHYFQNITFKQQQLFIASIISISCMQSCVRTYLILQFTPGLLSQKDLDLRRKVHDKFYDFTLNRWLLFSPKFCLMETNVYTAQVVKIRSCL